VREGAAEPGNKRLKLKEFIYYDFLAKIA
jgi:hypothetical protein